MVANQADNIMYDIREGTTMLNDGVSGKVGSIVSAFGGDGKNAAKNFREDMVDTENAIKQASSDAVDGTESFFKKIGLGFVAKKIDKIQHAAEESGFKSPEEKAKEEEKKKKANEENAKNEAKEREKMGMIAKFYAEFADCPKGFHDFAGMICIKNGCPKEFESCGPFCATAKECDRMI